MTDSFRRRKATRTVQNRLSAEQIDSTRGEFTRTAARSCWLASAFAWFRAPDLAREWRTAPLWGVADSAPYLHDGRAETLAEAILLHGGEAAPSARQFRELPGEKRAALIAFLESLVAPPPGGR